MGQKFKNVSRGTIGFGNGLRVEVGNVIELPDKLVEQKNAAIVDMIATGKLVTASGSPKKTKTEKPKAITPDKKSGKGKATTPSSKKPGKKK